MASGSSYAPKTTQRLPVEDGIRTPIPTRATRNLRQLKEDGQQDYAITVETTCAPFFLVEALGHLPDRRDCFPGCSPLGRNSAAPSRKLYL